MSLQSQSIAEEAVRAFLKSLNNRNDKVGIALYNSYYKLSSKPVQDIASIEKALEGDAEAAISVRGQERYVVMDMEEYNRLRVCELEAALYETRQQIADGYGVRSLSLKF